jgi:butyrate kinase
MIEAGDEQVALVYEAMALSVARSIAKLAVVIDGKVDVIVLTGGLAYSERFTGLIRKRVSFIASVSVLAGENEMQALAEGAYRVLSGEETAACYGR